MLKFSRSGELYLPLIVCGACAGTIQDAEQAACVWEVDGADNPIGEAVCVHEACRIPYVTAFDDADRWRAQRLDLILQHALANATPPRPQPATDVYSLPKDLMN